MQFFGLFGEHLSHSYSERIHSTFFDLIGMNAGYKHIELPPEELEAAIEGIRVLQFVGVNVTIPYKQTVMPYLDEITPEATRIGAVNTIKVKDGKLYGANTDYYGFGTMLASHDIAVENKTAMVLGFGGSAKAVVLYLLDNGINKIIIVSRKKGSLTDIPDDPRISLMSYDEIADISGDLIINTTPLGMFPDNIGLSAVPVGSDPSIQCSRGPDLQPAGNGIPPFGKNSRPENLQRIGNVGASRHQIPGNLAGTAFRT